MHYAVRIGSRIRRSLQENFALRPPRSQDARPRAFHNLENVNDRTETRLVKQNPQFYVHNSDKNVPRKRQGIDTRQQQLGQLSKG